MAGSEYPDDFIELAPTTHINAQIDTPARLAKILTDKHMNPRTVKATLQAVWNFVNLTDIHSLDSNTVSCTFKTQEGITSVLKGSPWSIRGAHIILKPWPRHTTFDKIEFFTSEFWSKYIISLLIA